MASTPDDIVKKLLAQISAGVSMFDKNVPTVQRQMLAEVELLAKGLQTNTFGSIIANAQNLRLVGQIQAKLSAIVKSPEYRASVKKYMQNFTKVSTLNDAYFGAVVNGYKQPPIVKELQSQSVKATLNSLLDAGISANVTSQIEDMLRTNITSGASYSLLANQLRDFIVNNGTGVGALQRYTKQITTDALNQYSAQYVRAVSHELGFNWFRYTGAEIETSRPFCKALLDKKFFNVEEIPDLLAGKFAEFAANDGKLNSKTGLPEGMVKGENEDNFFVYRGGYNCGHQIVGVPDESVPVEIKRDFFNKQRATANPSAPPPPQPAPQAPVVAPSGPKRAQPIPTASEARIIQQKAQELLAKFKPAKTIAEAEQFAKAAQLSPVVDYSLAEAHNLALINEINQAILKANAKGLPQYDKIQVKKTLAKDALMCNSVSHYKQSGNFYANELHINRSSNTTQAELESTYAKGWWVVKSVEDIINHENGHLITLPQTGSADYKAFSRSIARKHLNVSKYGSSNGTEALAEIWALYMREGKGALLPEYIEFFNKYSHTYKI